ncbi:MAG: TlpA family protein disulfide reductase [Muribaculaceae bacterium]|nr:TlpA family protein disulfide reductase [Muribaculaceae bacterium]
MNRLSSVLTIICLFFSICIASCITDEEADNNTGLTEGDKLPEFTVEMSDGKIVSSSDFSGYRGIIAFFNTDCRDCQQELPKLQRVYERTKDNVMWIAIARNENNASISKFWSANHLSIPYSPQPDRHIFELFASNGIPRLYLTADGIITHVFRPENIPAEEPLYKLLTGEQL